MSVYNSKANYHPVSQLAGHLTNGSYMLPGLVCLIFYYIYYLYLYLRCILKGNGYYSVTGTPPRIGLDHVEAVNDSKYLHSQSYRLDPINSLTNLKENTSLTKYYNHDFQVESCRDRYLFVPKFFPRDEINLLPDPSLERFKEVFFYYYYYRGDS